MIFYRIGNQLFATQAEAKAVSKDFEQIDIPTDKAGLMAYVQALLDKLDGPPLLADDCEGEIDTTPVPMMLAPSYSEVSVKIDEVFENLPLALQLHYAAIAMENARKRIV